MHLLSRNFTNFEKKKIYIVHSSPCKKKEVCSNCEIECTCVDKDSVKVQWTNQETIQNSFNKGKGNIIELKYVTNVNHKEENDLFQFRANVLNITFYNYASFDEEVVTCDLISIQNECRHWKNKVDDTKEDKNVNTKPVSILAKELKRFVTMRNFFNLHGLIERKQ